MLCATSGLYEWNLKKGIIAKYGQNEKGKFQIPAMDFRHLYFDKKDKTYWFATAQEGLIHWNPKTNESKNYLFHRQESNTIHAVYADDYGYLWLSTQNGLFQFDKSSKNFRAYFPKDGTSSNEFNRISHLQDTDGTIYFGSINGVTSFHPKDFQKAIEAEKTVKTIVLEISQYIGKLDKIKNVTNYYYENSHIKMRSDDRFLKISLALSDYEYSKNAIFYYRIKGVDKAWTENRNNEISLSGLPYGNQILEFKASLLNGQFSSVATIPVQILKPFYLTWWFLTLFLSMAILTIFLITQWRTKRLKTQKIELEKKVKERTEIIEQQTEELRQLDKTKSRFFANVSHELRTPITLIQAPIDTVLKTENLNTTNFNLLTKARQNTNNLLRLVNEILDLTRLESNKLILHEEHIVLYSFLRYVISNFQSIADQKSIELIFIYELRENLKLLLDKDKLEKIFNNLLSNALKFTNENGSIVITVSNQNNSNVLFSIKDSGRGIPQQDLPNIFNRFHQSSINTKAEGGFGIGLSLTKEFVDLMKGKIWAESSTDEVNHGSTFFIQIPKKEVMTMLTDEEQQAIYTENQLITNPLQLVQQLEKPIANTNTTILLVEDNHDLRAFIEFLLSPYYNVVTAENGQKALKWLEKPSKIHRLPSIIVSDVMMPIIDGFEFLETVKANDKWRGIPFIMLTARVELKDKLKALRIGVDDYIIKPFNETELLIRIENLLTNYQERQAFVEHETVENEAETDALIITEQEQNWLMEIETIIINEISDSLFSVDYLAEQLNYPRKKLYREIKRLTGLTPNQYIRSIRLKIAKDYLENKTYKTVKEVAYKVGFQAVDYFSKIFQAEYGKMPSDYL